MNPLIVFIYIYIYMFPFSALKENNYEQQILTRNKQKF